MKIMAISAHPDDIEINCAGTLARYAREGHSVTMCNLCNGSLGHMVIAPDELRKIRLNESRRSAALIGAEHICMDVNDLELYHEDAELRTKLADILRGVKPDVIITHTPEDYMPDHVAVNKLVFAATFCASLPHYRSYCEDGIADICPIFYMDNLGGFRFEPSEYVDITDTYPIKMEMLSCHESQMKWMLEHDKIDFAETVGTFARMRGLQCGARYAEGFRQFLGWGRMVAKRLLP